jgi:hypothetical protein
MAQRGRKSAASLSVVPNDAEKKLPEPPAELSEEEAQVWRDVVSTKPHDWFDKDTFPLLKDYCRHIIRQDKLSDLINHFEASDKPHAIMDLDRLLRASDRESKTIMALATKMRLSQQSKYGARQAETAARRGKGGQQAPWQFE